MSGSIDFLVNNMIYFLTQKIQEKIVASFDRLRGAISSRQLYVLFEPSLNCDAATDHLHPKDVYPIYQESVSAAESMALDQPFDEYGKNCAEMIRKYFETLLGDAARVQLAADDFMAQLFSMNKMQQRLFEMIRDLTEGNLIDRARLTEHITFLQQQLHSKQKIIMLYQQDFDNGEAERLERQRTELESLFKEQISVTENKSTGAKKQMQEMMKIQSNMVKQLQDQLLLRNDEKMALQQKIELLEAQLGEIDALKNQVQLVQASLAEKDEAMEKLELQLQNETARTALVEENSRNTIKNFEQQIADLEWKLDFERKKTASVQEHNKKDGQLRKKYEEALDTIGQITQREYETSQLADKLKKQLDGTMDELITLRNQSKASEDEKSQLRKEIEDLKAKTFQQSRDDQNRARMQLAQRPKPVRNDSQVFVPTQEKQEAIVQTDVTMISLTGRPPLDVVDLSDDTSIRANHFRVSQALGNGVDTKNDQEGNVEIQHKKKPAKKPSQAEQKEEDEVAETQSLEKAKSRPRKHKRTPKPMEASGAYVDILNQRPPSLLGSQTLAGTGSVLAASAGAQPAKLSASGAVPSQGYPQLMQALKNTSQVSAAMSLRGQPAREEQEASEYTDSSSDPQQNQNLEGWTPHPKASAKPAGKQVNGATREEKLVNLQASQDELEKQLQAIKSQIKTELKTASTLVQPKTLERIRQAQSPERVALEVQTDPGLGQSMSPQRRQLGILQRQILREAERLDQMMKENVYDDEEGKQRVVGADLMDSLVKQQQLVTQFRAQIEVLTALDYACVEQAENNLKKLRGFQDAWVQTALGAGACEAFVDATEPPDPLEQFRRELREQEIQAANQTLTQRGLRKIALAEISDGQEDAVLRVLQRRRKEIELFAGAQERVIQPYDRTRVFEALQEATAQFSQFSSMLIVQTADIKKRYTLLGLQLQRAKSGVAVEKRQKPAFLQVGRPMCLFK